MHLTVIILAGSNQLLPNSFPLDKNKELPSPTSRLSHPSKPPDRRRTSQDSRTSCRVFFFNTEPHFGLSEKENSFVLKRQWKYISLKPEIWWLYCYEEMILEITKRKKVAPSLCVLWSHTLSWNAERGLC